jgi:hypothetical protein
MIFFFRASFWTLVVAAFIPAGFYAPADGAFARQAEHIATSALESGQTRSANSAAVCQGRETLCETAGEFSRFAGWAASLAADRAERAYDDFATTRQAPAHASRSAEDIFAAAAADPAAR